MTFSEVYADDKGWPQKPHESLSQTVQGHLQEAASQLLIELWNSQQLLVATTTLLGEGIQAERSLQWFDFYLNVDDFATTEPAYRVTTSSVSLTNKQSTKYVYYRVYISMYTDLKAYTQLELL